MAGDKDNLPKMGEILGKSLDLEPPVPMQGNVYLGCQQRDFTPSPTEVAEKGKMFDHLLGDRRIDSDVKDTKENARRSPSAGQPSARGGWTQCF